jgi:hypothetical protein
MIVASSRVLKNFKEPEVGLILEEQSKIQGLVLYQFFGF